MGLNFRSRPFLPICHTLKNQASSFTLWDCPFSYRPIQSKPRGLISNGSQGMHPTTMFQILLLFPACLGLCPTCSFFIALHCLPLTRRGHGPYDQKDYCHGSHVGKIGVCTQGHTHKTPPGMLWMHHPFKQQAKDPVGDVIKAGNGPLPFAHHGPI